MKTIITIGSGRTTPSHIVVQGDHISDKHGELVLFEGGRITYEDYSSNGTIVNGKEIHNAQCEVRRGDTIIFPKNVALDWSRVPQVPPATSSTFATRHIGRDASNDIRYEEKQISRTHAMIRVNKNCDVTIYDKSVNGTTLNGAPVQRFTEIPVKHGKDRIVFAGRYELNWSQIPQPTSHRKLLVPVAGVLAVLAIVFVLWKNFNSDKTAPLPDQTPDTTTVVCSKEEEFEKHSVLVIRYSIAKLLFGNDVIYFGSDPQQQPSLSKENLKPFTSTGTAFGVREDGYFTTNYHVVASYAESEKALADELLLKYRKAMEAIIKYANSIGYKIKYEDITYETQKIVVVKDGNRVYSRTFTNYENLPAGQFYEVTIHLEDQLNDLAIIRLTDSDLNKQFSYLPFDCIGNDDDIKPNTQVRYIGYPANKIINFEGGEIYYDVSKYRSSGQINKLEDNGRDFMADYTNAGGASGSPVYDLQTGKLIGINRAMRPDAPNQQSGTTSFAIKVGHLRKLMEQLPPVNN